MVVATVLDDFESGICSPGVEAAASGTVYMRPSYPFVYHVGGVVKNQKQ